jgi:hypothetical protein
MIFTTNALLVLVSIAMAALRIGGMTNEFFQAVAHLWVGGLFAAGYMEHKWTWATKKHGNAKIKFALGCVLSFVELMCFLTMRHA